MTEITMPALTDSMEQGTIISWLVNGGDWVTKGEELLEVETDKATVTLEAEAEGQLSILAPEGSTVNVGALIARIGVAGAGDGVTGSGDRNPAEPVVTAVTAAPETPSSASANGAAATPLARRIAAAHDIPLHTLVGSGPRGRIIKTDVLEAAGIAPPAGEWAPAAAPEMLASQPPIAPVPADATLQPLTPMQQTIASRMAQQALVPCFQVQTDVEMDAALAFREQLKASAGDRPTPSVNDLIVRACATALRDHPLVNGAYRSDGFVIHERIHVGIAVAVATGLLVVTIPDTDTKSLGQIAAEARRLAERARAGTATPAELSGGTFTVSNLGMFGMTQITPLINPPQAAILGVGTTRPTLARDEHGEIVERQLVAFNLTCDHRILNGADGSRFLQDVKRILEQPLRLAL